MTKQSENLDGVEILKIHRETIQKNNLLRSTYVNFYKKLSKYSQKNPIIELGSGAGFIKEVIPKVITTDIVKESSIDKIISAEKLPFKNSSIGTILMLNTFHHIKNPEKALKEFDRVLKTRGKIAMIEPCNSFWARFIYTFFHHENFDPKAKWKITGKGRLSDANGAAPWIIFVRDRKMFNKKFPRLKIKLIDYHTPLAYLLSGGLSKPQMLSSLNYTFVKKIEDNFRRFNKKFSMFMTVIIAKE